MKIETKYSLGDIVWYIYGNHVNKSKINCINVHNYLDNCVYYHLCNSDETFKENELFSTKEELLKTL